MVDGSVDQSAGVDCEFTAAWELLRDGYPCRWVVTAVVDCTLVRWLHLADVTSARGFAE